MKRHPCLVPLSDDHHRALVLARRLTRLAKQGVPDLAALRAEVQREFEAELEPHFRVEERWLVPPLERAGATPLAGRLREDHARLRQLVRGRWTPEGVAELGGLLESHVRFEERVLFPEAEALLAQDELEAVRVACLGRAG